MTNTAPLKPQRVATYKGCMVLQVSDGFAWEEIHYGAESDDVFPTVDACKANIDLFFGDGPAPVDIDGEIYA